MNALADVRFLSPSAISNKSKHDSTKSTASIWGFMDPSRALLQHATAIRVARLHRQHHRAGRNSVDEWRAAPDQLRGRRVEDDGVFNLGGDLALFREAIARHDRETLVAYGRNCVDNLYPWSRNCDLPLTTISLVQGEALGGGFECALSASVLIAEESSRMGFPEILFNLFPGMGAYSFLTRKVGRGPRKS